jgi:hypothetical protein
MAKSPRPSKRRVVSRKCPKSAFAFKLTGEGRQIAALARKAQAEERGIGSAMRGYHARRQFDQRLAELADRVARKPRALRDDLLTLALAGKYAASARDTLIRAILRAGGMNPDAPHLKVRARR